MQMTMTRVAAITILATNAVLPRYGDSSSLKNCSNQDSEEGIVEMLCAVIAMLNSRESSQPQIRQLERVLVLDFPHGHEQDNGMQDVPS
jgi:hypothetical protein